MARDLLFYFFVRRTWCAIFIFSISVLMTTGALADIPNGLALVVRERGKFGHGFVVGKYVVSAGHCFSERPLIFIVQNGKWVEVTASIIGTPKFHPEFRQITDFENPTLHMVPWDLGWVELSQPFKTDFVLDDSKNVGSVEADSQELFIGSTLKDAPDAIIPISPGPVGVRLQPLEDGTLIITSKNLENNAFIDTDTKLIKGQSGSPLFRKLKTGKLLVRGVLSAVFANPSADLGTGSVTTAYAAASNLRDLLKIREPAENKENNLCQELFDSAPTLTTYEAFGI